MRENEFYRDVLEDLLSFFNGKRLLSISDVASYCGRSERWAKEHFEIDRRAGMSVVVLARKLSKGE